jgi:hypothetical protein
MKVINKKIVKIRSTVLEMRTDGSVRDESVFTFLNSRREGKNSALRSSKHSHSISFAQLAQWRNPEDLSPPPWKLKPLYEMAVCFVCM